jgi:hypothetical protein
MFRSYDHHQAADSAALSQAVCLTAIAVSWDKQSQIVVTVVVTNCGYLGNQALYTTVCRLMMIV